MIPETAIPLVTIGASLLGSLGLVAFTAGRLSKVINGHGQDIKKTRQLAESTNSTVTEMRITQGKMEERQIHFEVRLQNVELDR